MENVLELLSGSLGNKMVSQLSSEVGIGDEQKTEVAMDSVMKTMLAAIGKNAQSPQGMQALDNAIRNDHDGSIFEDIAGNLLNRDAKMAQGNERMLNGAGILRNVFGSKENNVFNSLSKSTGVEKNQLMSLAVKLAPFVLGALGKARNNQSSGGGLGNILSGVLGSMQSNNSGQSSFLNSILDQDGDGSITDDVAGIGMKVFGNFFRK
ncbi:DUF937 domain-containing protein [Membranihabitans maritimus]|uniref:DUF937 domain-containing protein n=1 Tax=Membranihabitans maritimus TaxID=2904244 RepID=UPI001F327430|nr:DUF937 domain-containing protein [Membranihabitans maritimus]